MDIGKRLRELRALKGMSQGDIEHATGLLRCYLSRVENGHTVPSIPVLERLAGALKVGLPQLFAAGGEEPHALELQKETSIGAQERTLLGLFGKVSKEDKPLLISLAREMVKRAGHSTSN